MKRFATGLLVVLLAAGLSFPVPAVALEGSASEELLAGQVLVESSGDAWYVSPDGSDSAETNGSIDDPFATISYAVSRMEGGDTVYVRGGVYRDEITSVPSGSASSPTTIRAYGDEEVWLTGGEEVGGWRQVEGNRNIWVADVDWDMRDISEYSELGAGEDGGHYAQTAYYDNLVFAGGAPAPEGRWPNASVDQFLDRDRYAVADRASAESIVDADLPDGMDFAGSEVWIASGGGYESQMGTVLAYQPDDHRLRIRGNASGGSWMYTPTGGNYYYVTKGLETLDSANEWYKDREARKLYLYEPDGVDPASLGIEAQKRAHVVKIGYGKDSGDKVTYEPASYITISGINARLGSVAFGPKTDHCTFERSTLDCPDHKLSSQAYGVATGILISGSDNLVTLCEVEHAYGSAVTLWGRRNSVVNNHIHDTGYEHHEEQAAIRIGGSEQLVFRNSVHHVMRQAVEGFFEASVISYNDLYDCMRVSRDGGVVYFNAHDFGNSEFHHNWLHDTHDFPSGHMHVGLYMDSFSTSLVVYRNVVYGIQGYEPGNRQVNNNGKHLTYQINPNSLNNVIVNNTFLNYRPTHLNFYPNHDISGTVFLNNIYQSLSFIDGPTYYPWNWYDQWDRRSQKGIGGVKRDILAEMGALFADNMEGKFRNNTWPPIEDQWTDSANGDYTLSSASSAIDAGRVISGVTDGFTGSAPDLGAYEYGEERWVPGCDFDADYAGALASERALNDRIPYRNVLVNRGFENVADGDFEDWDEHGTPQASPSMSAWGTWGWIVKEGSRCAVLDSDGDALVQRVSGLKPNAAYSVGGYAFVAGQYVRPDGLTRAKTADSQDVGDSRLSSLRRASAMSLSGLGQLEFDGVDFGAGRDRIVIGLKSPQYFADEASRQTISVALGDSGNIVGSYTVDRALSTAEISWRWATIDLGSVYAGSQDVFLVLSGSSFSKTSLSGFLPDRSTSTDTLAISAAHPDGTQAGQATVSSLYKPFEGSYYAEHATVVMTDSTGTLDVSVSKQGSDLVGYADEIMLAEVPHEQVVGDVEGCSHVFEKGSCDPRWEWVTLEDTDYVDAEHKGLVTLTCTQCGERVSVEAPTSSDDDGRLVTCHASYGVVGGVLEDEREFPVTFYEVAADTGEHGSVSAVSAQARRGSAVEVAVEPEDGYDVASLAYERAGKGAVDILAERRFVMPASNVALKATFKPTVASASFSAIEGFQYTGLAHEPTPTLTYRGKELVEGVDYSLSYEDNVEVGTATVVATGLGDYVGSKRATFAIVSAADPDAGGEQRDDGTAADGGPDAGDDLVGPVGPRAGGAEAGAAESAGDAARDNAVSSRSGQVMAGGGAGATSVGREGVAGQAATAGGDRAAAGNDTASAEGAAASDEDAATSPDASLSVRRRSSDISSKLEGVSRAGRIESGEVQVKEGLSGDPGKHADSAGQPPSAGGESGDGAFPYGGVADLLVRYWLVRSCFASAVVIVLAAASAVRRRKPAS